MKPLYGTRAAKARPGQVDLKDLFAAVNFRKACMTDLPIAHGASNGQRDAEAVLTQT